MATTEKNYYLILGLSRTATYDDIRHAYRMLAMRHHPDRNEGSRESEELFKEIQEAYHVLSDSEKRRKYDLAKTWNFSYSYFRQVRHYFIVHSDRDEVRLNEEFTITFTYTGEGRFFQKPPMQLFYITGKPYVTFRKIVIDGVEVKETSLEYTVSAMHTGELVLGPATIRIHNEAYTTAPLRILVTPAPCYFRKNAEAGDHPLLYPMHARLIAGTEHHKVSYYQDHVVVIPRSEAARYYHHIGTCIKIGCAGWGFFLFAETGLNELAGLLAGSLFGGICCQLFYLGTGMKSKFYYAARYPVVALYEARGYRKGRYSGSRYLTGTVLRWFTELFG